MLVKVEFGGVSLRNSLFRTASLNCRRGSDVFHLGSLADAIWAIGQWPRRATGAHDRGAQQADSPDWEMKADCKSTWAETVAKRRILE